MHPLTTTHLARAIDAERDAAIRRAIAVPTRHPWQPRAATRRERRWPWRVWRLRLTLGFWRLAGRVTGRRGRWVWDSRA